MNVTVKPCFGILFPVRLFVFDQKMTATNTTEERCFHVSLQLTCRICNKKGFFSLSSLNSACSATYCCYFLKRHSSWFISEISPDGAERLRGALRFSSRSDHVRKPGSSAVLPPVWDVICRREHERPGLSSLLPSHPALLPASCTWIFEQIPYRYTHEHIYYITIFMVYLSVVSTL